MTPVTAAALTVEGRLMNELSGEGTWRVHSVFDRVVNLERSGELMAVAARSVPNAPRTIVIDTARLTGFGIRAGQPVHHRAGRMQVGCLTVDCHAGRRWEPRLPRRGAIDDSRTIIRDAVVRQGISGGALAGAAGVGGLAEAMSAKVRDALTTVVRSSSGSDADIRRALRRLVGVGVGLTPSGDDVLVGAFVTGRWLGGRAGRLAEAATVLNFTPLTTALSASALSAAREGRGPEPLHDLLLAIAGGCEAEIAHATVSLTSIGHTSGTDLAMGVLAALDLYFDQGGSR